MQTSSFPFTADLLGFTSDGRGVGRGGRGYRVYISGFSWLVSPTNIIAKGLLFWALLVHSQGKECKWHVQLVWFKHGTFPYLTDQGRLSGRGAVSSS